MKTKKLDRAVTPLIGLAGLALCAAALIMACSPAGVVLAFVPAAEPERAPAPAAPGGTDGSIVTH